MIYFKVIQRDGMHKIEKLFDINTVLMTLFSSLEAIRDEKGIELIYDMHATIPKELRGDSALLLRSLTKILTFIFQNTDQKEIVLSLEAPKDFIYEEYISFKIQNIDTAKEKTLEFLETNLRKELESLEGKIIYVRDEGIHLDIPFKINELGYRRHYRLPDVSMLNKKVLLISGSKYLSQSIKEMFNYFKYDVDVGFDAFQSQGNDLTPYDILILEDKYNTEELEHIIARVQQNIPLKYVLLQDDHHVERKTISVSTHLIKPVTEESVFELIVSLFKNEKDSGEKKIQAKENIVDLEKILQVHKHNEKHVNPSSKYEENLKTMIEKRREIDLPVLDKKLGEENIKKMGLKYTNELKNFLDSFGRSDIYFREIVSENAMHKIKEFSLDLEKHAKLIGAQSILKLAETVNLIFVYNKLELLPIYPGKYHIELQKLITEIKKELRIK